jgi:hypothetical protein
MRLAFCTRVQRACGRAYIVYAWKYPEKRNMMGVVKQLHERWRGRQVKVMAKHVVMPHPTRLSHMYVTWLRLMCIGLQQGFSLPPGHQSHDSR